MNPPFDFARSAFAALLLLFLSSPAASQTPLEYVVQRGHADNVYALSFWPGGGLLATGSDDGTLRLWRVSDGTLVRVISGYGSVDSLHFSPDGRWLAAGVSQGRVIVWDAPALKVARCLTLSAYRCVVRFSPDSRTLAIGARDGGVRLYENFREVRVLPGEHGPISSLSWSPDGRVLASGSWWDDTITLWPGPVLRGHEASVYGVAFGPDGTLASASRDGTLRLWEEGRCRQVLRAGSGFIHALAWSGDGTLIATAHEDSCTRLWSQGRVVHTLGSPEPLPDAEYSQGVAISADSTLVAIGRRWGNVRIADARTGQLRVDVPRTPPAAVQALAVSPDGARLAVTRSDGTTAVWDLRRGRLLAWLAGHRQIPREHHTNMLTTWPGKVAWTARGELICERDGSLEVWDGRSLRVRPGTLPVSRRAASPEGRSLSLGQPVTAWARWGSHLITGDAAGDVAVWEARTGTLQRRFYLLTPDGATQAEWVVTSRTGWAGSTGARVWTGKRLAGGKSRPPWIP